MRRESGIDPAARHMAQDRPADDQAGIGPLNLNAKVLAVSDVQRFSTGWPGAVDATMFPFVSATASRAETPAK